MRRFKVCLCILLLALTVMMSVTLLSACGTEYTLTLSGGIYPGASLTPILTGPNGEVLYGDNTYEVAVLFGSNIVSAENGVLSISNSAKVGDEFSLSVSGDGAKASARFAVEAPPVSKVTVSCQDEAEAGERVELTSKISPSAIYGVEEATYSVEGKATIVGSALVIDADAGRGDVVIVKASYGGVTSSAKRISVTTYQPKEIFVAGEDRVALPGATISVAFSVDPEYVSYPLEVTLTAGAEYADYDKERGELTFEEDAPMGAEVSLTATCNLLSKTLLFRVDYPPAKDIEIYTGNRNVAPGEERTFSYSLVPSDADISKAEVRLALGSEYIDWQGGDSFIVNYDAPQGSEITFIVRTDTVQKVLTYVVEKRTADSISIEKEDTDYLKSGEKVVFSYNVEPADWAGDVTYYILEGAELVTGEGACLGGGYSAGVFTVREDAGVGEVRVVAETSDGVRSNELTFSVSGRYSRRAYSSWQNVTFATTGEDACVWMILPPALNAADATIIVPREVTDIIIEGRYDGTEATAYRNLYFYFRNTAERTVTLKNFATKATAGLGGVVMDFGSSGTTEIALLGENAIYADTPYYLDNTGEKTDGDWIRAGAFPSASVVAWRSGKYGYNGTNGGTAISGYELVFLGSGSLLTVAGDGTDGTAGGNGADACYEDGVTLYLSGNGGDGGNGGDSGAAIHAYRVTFVSGAVTAIAGNAGMGGAGGSRGGISALAGLSVTAVLGDAGVQGRDGVPVSAVNAKFIVGAPTEMTEGTVKSTQGKAGGSLDSIVQKLSSFYGVKIYYGTKLDNPYRDYKMTQQTDVTKLLQQTQFLLYTFSMMPKNFWKEIAYLSGRQVKIYLANKINNGGVLGLTSSDNKVWFATFDTEMRGVVYSGYFNIMLHEFTHVCHYNLSSSAAFEKAMAELNFGLSYGTSSSQERVYGMGNKGSAEECCFLSAYSRKTVREDVAETLSMCSVFVRKPDFLAEGMPVRTKLKTIITNFARSYETLSLFKAPNLFVYDRLFEDAAA